MTKQASTDRNSICHKAKCQWTMQIKLIHMDSSSLLHMIHHGECILQIGHLIRKIWLVTRLWFAKTHYSTHLCNPLALPQKKTHLCRMQLCFQIIKKEGFRIDTAATILKDPRHIWLYVCVYTYISMYVCIYIYIICIKYNTICVCVCVFIYEKFYDHL